MDMNKPIESWGVFKPVGHTLITFKNAKDVDEAVKKLLALGFKPEDLLRYTPDEMVKQVDTELPNASVLAEFGQELNLAKAHRALAVQGCSFLLVHESDSATRHEVDELVQDLKVPTAQRYGRFIIEELAPQEPRQVLASRLVNNE
jgi:hypothetical protein